MTKKIATAKWYKLDVARQLARVMCLSDEEAGAYFRNMLMALATGVVGMCEEADDMLQESSRISEARRRSARARWGEKGEDKDANAVGGDANAMQLQSKCNANPVCLSVDTLSNVYTKRESYPARARGENPTKQEVLDRAAVIGMTEADAEEFFEYWENSGWVDRHGVPVRNWHGVMASRLSDLRNKPVVPASRRKTGKRKGQEYEGHSEVDVV